MKGLPLYTKSDEVEVELSIANWVSQLCEIIGFASREAGSHSDFSIIPLL